MKELESEPKPLKKPIEHCNLICLENCPLKEECIFVCRNVEDNNICGGKLQHLITINENLSHGLNPRYKIVFQCIKCRKSRVISVKCPECSKIRCKMCNNELGTQLFKYETKSVMGFKCPQCKYGAEFVI